ncbi:MAG: molybdopterin-synthase adenylyltransferase MoeB [Gammaproteobacteria bacterium]|nr:molybdopterin-synthase adenylyltransferase MoeB [Gammaproteobacteria bacterium]MBT5203092.1 molybdopterin-synthase adenylyltransferase MoeB [Gammaproteobacteria bacterium]MBT5602740.1 molybdopterin-synthase adenylyltransferase MoeB [Gammaproteobacteria bacterium]MBT6247077.1 molybdopterin-synthase adenylyltransferase MoeB [Gammaproteobacteria bacterium]
MEDSELLRYSRHILLPEIDLSGQEKLLAAHVAIIGMGGLGSPVALYLASSGIGRLSLVDFDSVDLSNLQRQIIHDTSQLGNTKVSSAATRLADLNPGTQVDTYPEKLSDAEIDTLIRGVDAVVDCTDNFAIRLKINQACVTHQVALISGAAIRLEGQIMVYDPNIDNAPCYACLYQNTEELDLNCATTGVAAPLVGIIGSMQAMETLKVLLSFGEPVTGTLLIFDAASSQWQRFRVTRRTDCPACGGAN